MTDLDRQILEFESKWWRYAGDKEAVIRDQFGWSPIRYAQRLNSLLDDPEAHAHDPHLVRRLRRIRDGRETARQQRRDLR